MNIVFGVFMGVLVIGFIVLNVIGKIYPFYTKHERKVISHKILMNKVNK